jgi:hypothetical protein
MTAYRIIRTPDARSRGAVSFFDVERVAADGRRQWIATTDNRAEARELVRGLEADNQAARDASTAAELAAARDAADRLQNRRRKIAGGHPLAWKGYRATAGLAGMIAEARDAAAARLRAARAAYMAADAAADCRW